MSGKMQDTDLATTSVILGLKKLYKASLLPMEQLYLYSHFYTNAMTDAEFDAKPQVLMIGQYSTGKTTFIKYLVGRDVPGSSIGPEPTTDKFACIMYGPDERIIPGNALSVSPDLPYRGLQKFGMGFLNRFEGATIPSPVLRNITIVDTPGILSGEKQRVQRGYDFVTVCSWFAERCDLILLLFDAHKLDISDEFRTTIESLKDQSDKIRCILNKADQVDRQKLMRVYGALMWAMGKVTKTPEVLRVYTGSFWDQPLQYEDNANLFEREEVDLMKDLKNLPRNSAIRKINELVKRTRKVKVHAYILAHLRSEMPSLTGKQKKQDALMNDLPNVFRQVMKKYGLPAGDFPEIEHFKSKLGEMSFGKFPKENSKMINALDNLLSTEIPRLMDALPADVSPNAGSAPNSNSNGNGGSSSRATAVGSRHRGPSRDSGFVSGNALHTNVPDVATPSTHKVSDIDKANWAAAHAASVEPKVSSSWNKTTTYANGNANANAVSRDSNPFGDKDEDDNVRDSNPFGDEEEDSEPWVLQDEKDNKWDSIFLTSNPENGKLSAGNARKALMKTEVPTKMLRAIWDLSDIDKDGMLDDEEFAVAMHLCEMVREGREIPGFLEEGMIPILKRMKI